MREKDTNPSLVDSIK